IFQDDVQETFAEAIQDTNICVIYRDDLQRFLLKYPTISLKLLQEFSHRLDTSEKQTMQFATEKVELRIAHLLVENLSDDKEETEHIQQKGQRFIQVLDADALLLI